MVRLVHRGAEGEGESDCVPLRPLLSHTQCHRCCCLIHRRKSKARPLPPTLLLSSCGDAQWVMYWAG